MEGAGNKGGEVDRQQISKHCRCRLWEFMSLPCRQRHNRKQKREGNGPRKYNTYNLHAHVSLRGG